MFWHEVRYQKLKGNGLTEFTHSSIRKLNGAACTGLQLAIHPTSPVFSRQPNVIKRTGMTQLTQDCERSDLQIHPLAGSISEPMLEWTQTCLHHYCSFYSVGSSSPLLKTYVFIQIYWVDTNNLLLIFSLHFSLDLPALVFCLCLFLRVRLLFRFELFSFDTLIKSNCSSAERSLTMLRIQNEQVCKV